jgi:TNF receptor-associated protein 1
MASTDHREFQAEVRQLLDIVIHSLYTDKEIFVRELVSNASDALDKLAHVQLTERDITDAELPLEIHLTTDEAAGTLTIADHGIGMTEAELVENLGTIAHSGTKAFMQALKESGKEGKQLIGQFGVGFYSGFMAATKVEVFTRSWRSSGSELCWSSDGSSGYDITPAPGQKRGCRMVLHLKDDCRDFAKAEVVKGILEKYSAFVSYPILLNGERVNTVEALWLKSKSEITAEQYDAFYKFQAKAYDAPSYTFHFSADAPRVINALVFAPTENMELWGMGQMEPGVALYCKKVLIDPKPPKLLPEWMRFLRGVIDSEDIPLNISRESMQDSTLVRRIGETVAKRFLRFLEKEATDDPTKYDAFYGKFSRFLKEGAATDNDNRESIAKLLRFESSMTEAGKTTSFTDYVSRMKDGQKGIFYQVGASRSAIEKGPYVEGFKARGYEVIYLYEAIDDYVVNHLREVEGKSLHNVSSDDIELDDAPETEGPGLTEDASTKLCDFLKATLGERVTDVRTGKRLVSSPAVALVPEGELSPQMRQMMRAMRKDSGMPEAKVLLEINAKSALIHSLSSLAERDSATATLIAEQLLDNSMLAANLIDDPQSLIERNLKLMEALAAKA